MSPSKKRRLSHPLPDLLVLRRLPPALPGDEPGAVLSCRARRGLRPDKAHLSGSVNSVKKKVFFFNCLWFLKEFSITVNINFKIPYYLWFIEYYFDGMSHLWNWKKYTETFFFQCFFLMLTGSTTPFFL